MRVVIIGTGNTAHVLGRLILQKGHNIVSVLGREWERTSALASILNAQAGLLDPAALPEAELYILAIADRALPEVAASFFLKKGLLVHTAGSVSIDVLKKSCKNYGILYPLQSLRKEATELPMIPLLVDGNTSEDRTLLIDFARTLSDHVQLANDEQRRHLHLGAILVNNFPNYLYARSEDYCQQHNVDFRMLLPLIQQTSNRLFTQSPKDTQTGPAIRGDHATIASHLQLLSNEPELKNLYELFTQYIQAYYLR